MCEHLFSDELVLDVSVAVCIKYGLAVEFGSVTYGIDAISSKHSHVCALVTCAAE